MAPSRYHWRAGLARAACLCPEDTTEGLSVFQTPRNYVLFPPFELWAHQNTRERDLYHAFIIPANPNEVVP
jgi:hypothetical protein